MIKVKLTADWRSAELSYKTYCRLFTENDDGVWRNIQLVTEDPDYYAIINKPSQGSSIVPEKTIVFHAEPLAFRKLLNFNQWAEPDKSKFLAVENFNYFWCVDNYRDLLDLGNIEKTKVMSGVVSSKVQLEGHRKRVKFIDYLDKLPSYDHFGKGNFSIKSYKGHIKAKRDGLYPYKYTFCPDNTEDIGFMTEKLIDAVLSECLGFYWGCSNAEDFVNPDAFIQLDLNNYDECFEIVRTAIENNEWEKRIDIIREEKKRILNDCQLLSRINDIVTKADNGKS